MLTEIDYHTQPRLWAQEKLQAKTKTSSTVTSYAINVDKLKSGSWLSVYVNRIHGLPKIALSFEFMIFNRWVKYE